MVGIVSIFGPVEKEIMGTGTDFGAGIADIRRAFKKPAHFRGKICAVQGTAPAAAFGAERGTVRIAAQRGNAAGVKVVAFRPLPGLFIGIMGDRIAVAADFP